MKNKLKIIAIFFTFILLLLINNVSLASNGTFSVSKSSVTLKEGESSNITITTTDCAGKFVITSSDSSVVKVGGESSIWVEGSKSITLIAVKKGNATITIEAADVSNNDEEPKPVTGNKKISITVNSKSNPSDGGENSGGGSSNGESESNETIVKKPKFKLENKKVYTTGTVNLRSSWSTSSSATQVAKGTELTLTGTSNEIVNGYIWFRVLYKGSTKYVASNLITYTKPEEKKPEEEKKEEEKPEEEKKEEEKNKSSNKNLLKLSIDGANLEPEFNKDITKYTVNIKEDIKKLKINTETEDSKAKVMVEGNEELTSGDNVIKIKVIAEDNTIRTYFITAKKEDNDQKELKLKLSELKIKGVNFENTFNPDIYTYKLVLNKKVSKLDITAVANEENAKIEIIGNDEFKEGTNIVTILITSEKDSNKKATYQIEVELSKEVMEAKDEQNDGNLYIMGGAIILLLIIAIISLVIHNKNKSKEYMDTDDNDNIEVNSSNFLNEEEIKKVKGNKTKGKHSV